MTRKVDHFRCQQPSPRTRKHAKFCCPGSQDDAALRYARKLHAKAVRETDAARRGLPAECASTASPAGLLLLREIFGPLALALRKSSRRAGRNRSCHPRQLLMPSGQPRSRRQACSSPVDCPSSLVVTDAQHSTYPAESFPQHWYQGCRFRLHHLSLDLLSAATSLQRNRSH